MKMLAILIWASLAFGEKPVTVLDLNDLYFKPARLAAPTVQEPVTVVDFDDLYFKPARLAAPSGRKAAQASGKHAR
jgi:hypothetical protein